MCFYGQDSHKSGSSIITDLSRRIKPINVTLEKYAEKAGTWGEAGTWQTINLNIRISTISGKTTQRHSG
jgi:hypothetical protein